MIITMLAEIDYAGSGHKLCEAIKRYTEHDIEIFTGKYYNPYKHPDNSKWNIYHLQTRINDSDIVHLKGDFPPGDGYLNLRITHKPIIITVSGSHFRKRSHGGYEKFRPNQYGAATLKTSFEPDLLYPEFSETWTPHPIDSADKKIEWKPNDVPVLMHIPTNKGTKGTDFIKEVFDILKTKHRLKIVMPEKLSHAKAIEERKKATIYFDQFTVGFYGNSALEAMQYGIPVAAWISPLARTQARGALNTCPVITTEKNVMAWVRLIEETLRGDMTLKSQRTKIWCDAIHGYEWIAEQWNEIYNAI